MQVRRGWAPVLGDEGRGGRARSGACDVGSARAPRNVPSARIRGREGLAGKTGCIGGLGSFETRR